MKTKILIIAGITALLFSTSTFAQEDEENNASRWLGNDENQVETLFNKDQNFTHGGYAGLEFGYTEVSGRPALLSGFSAAWVIDHTLELGIVGKGYATNPLPDLYLENESYMYTGGYGGLHIAANVFGEKPINVSFPLTVGAGSISYIKTQKYNYYDDYSPESHYAYFVVEPGVELQLNMTRFFRISAGVSYRYTSDIYLIYSSIDAQAIESPSIMRGLNAGIKLKFGKF